MAVLEVIRMCHPTLREIARELTPEEIASESTARLIEDMRETLHAYGGIGLAAPQVNVPVRLAIIEMEGGTNRYVDVEGHDFGVYINPVLKPQAGPGAGYWEGCLSIPGMRGYVERPQHLIVDYVDVAGVPQTLEARGFLATVFQHEFDHLDGTLYIDRLASTELLAFDEEYNQFIAEP